MNSFSQTVTEIKDTTHIVLSTDTARKIAIDLLEGDAAKEQVNLLEEKVVVLDSTILIQQKQIDLQKEQTSTQAELLTVYKTESEQNIREMNRLNRELRTYQTWTTVCATTAGVSIVAFVCVLLLGGK